MTSAAEHPAARALPMQARSRRRYDEICAAAIRLLRRGGLPACTMAAVAAEASMTPTSLYRYFPHVEALLHAVAEVQLDLINDELDRRLTGLRDAAEARAALLDGLEAFEDLFRSDGALRAVWAGSLAVPSMAELNVNDSRRNGLLLAERLAPFRSTPLGWGRAVLTAHVVGAGMVLLLHLDDAEAAEVRDELRDLLLALVDR